MRKEMSTESVSVERINREQERLLKYKLFATVFSYPEDELFKLLPHLLPEKERLVREYDAVFRSSGTWIYGVEYLAKNEFQRADYLSRIMGFYKAFGLEPDKDRPDALSFQLEFMHFLVFKFLYAIENKNKIAGNIEMEIDQRCAVCFDAQEKFFSQFLGPSGERIAKMIILKAPDSMYAEFAREMLIFLETEKCFFREEPDS
jgi:TorA maturation chaperone TorD